MNRVVSCSTLFVYRFLVIVTFIIFQYFVSVLFILNFTERKLLNPGLHILKINIAFLDQLSKTLQTLTVMEGKLINYYQCKYQILISLFKYEFDLNTKQLHTHTFFRMELEIVKIFVWTIFLC